ncbi:MAG: hypothetical protein OCU20_04740 [Methanophagales archaeon]|nr:hypothetical protein [Methanophagales archaeon]
MEKVVIVNILFLDTDLLTSEQLGTLVEELKKEFKVLYVLRENIGDIPKKKAVIKKETSTLLNQEWDLNFNMDTT